MTPAEPPSTRWWWLPVPPLLAGGLLLLVVVGLSMADVVWSDSSTAALGLLFLPLLEWLVVLGTVAAVLFLGVGRQPAGAPADRP